MKSQKTPMNIHNSIEKKLGFMHHQNYFLNPPRESPSKEEKEKILSKEKEIKAKDALRLDEFSEVSNSLGGSINFINRNRALNQGINMEIMSSTKKRAFLENFFKFPPTKLFEDSLGSLSFMSVRNSVLTKKQVYHFKMITQTDFLDILDQLTKYKNFQYYFCYSLNGSYYMQINYGVSKQLNPVEMSNFFDCDICVDDFDCFDKLLDDGKIFDIKIRQNLNTPKMNVFNFANGREKMEQVCLKMIFYCDFHKISPLYVKWNEEQKKMETYYSF